MLLGEPKILLLDEPTKGVDVGAKNEIYKIMLDLVREGISIIMISSELPELLAMCDRFVVLAGGRIADEFDKADASEHRVMLAATSAGGIGSGSDGPEYQRNCREAPPGMRPGIRISDLHGPGPFLRNTGCARIPEELASWQPEGKMHMTRFSFLVLPPLPDLGSDDDIRRTFDLVKSCGYDGVELNLTPATFDYLDRLDRWLSESGLSPCLPGVPGRRTVTGCASVLPTRRFGGALYSVSLNTSTQPANSRPSWWLE